MPRIKRGLDDGMVYHVLNRGNAKREVFHENGDYFDFLSLMKKMKHAYGIKIYSYCLMPNHFHMGISPDRGPRLSDWMQWIMTSHVRRYNKFHESTGHVWQGRYKSFPIESDEHFLRVMRYIERNPVRAGLVARAEDWQWSSCRSRLLRDQWYCLLERPPVTLPSNWMQLVNEELCDKELVEIRTCLARKRPYGDPAWQDKICKMLGLESTLRTIGRPKKP